ncbi:toxin-antitoxin system YwqK family antitoxin [Candidatus Omnitrophota bacterium]
MHRVRSWFLLIVIAVVYCGGCQLLPTQEVKREYYDNGTLLSETNYRGEKKHGISKTYYENGALKSQGLYRNDKRHGVFSYFAEDGTLLTQFKYKSGAFIGGRDYYTSGVVKAETYPGKSIKSFYESGALMSEVVYKNGVPVVQRNYQEGGRLHSELMYGEDSAGFRMYDENGNAIGEIHPDDTMEEMMQTLQKGIPAQFDALPDSDIKSQIDVLLGSLEGYDERAEQKRKEIMERYGYGGEQ